MEAASKDLEEAEAGVVIAREMADLARLRVAELQDTETSPPPAVDVDVDVDDRQSDSSTSSSDDRPDADEFLSMSKAFGKLRAEHESLQTKFDEVEAELEIMKDNADDVPDEEEFLALKAENRKLEAEVQGLRNKLEKGSIPVDTPIVEDHSVPDFHESVAVPDNRKDDYIEIDESADEKPDELAVLKAENSALREKLDTSHLPVLSPAEAAVKVKEAHARMEAASKDLEEAEAGVVIAREMADLARLRVAELQDTETSPPPAVDVDVDVDDRQSDSSTSSSDDRPDADEFLSMSKAFGKLRAEHEELKKENQSRTRIPPNQV
eukprot:TRINITY_DN310_c0_g1_i8.p1 TRINITY_DN310_c0_g1~~TRINITY_DN310_c0_g1_i8.p1  ORF type:complete len:323 (+),score=132.99 TRINITY_DN310_c0_g1_i8:434-1402(+)